MPDDPFIGKTITLPDGPWAGMRVRIVACGPVSGARLPLPYYTLQRLDTGQHGYRMMLEIMMLALRQGVVGANAKEG